MLFQSTNAKFRGSFGVGRFAHTIGEANAQNDQRKSCPAREACGLERLVSVFPKQFTTAATTLRKTTANDQAAKPAMPNVTATEPLPGYRELPTTTNRQVRVERTLKTKLCCYQNPPSAVRHRSLNVARTKMLEQKIKLAYGT